MNQALSTARGVAGSAAAARRSQHHAAARVVAQQSATALAHARHMHVLVAVDMVGCVAPGVPRRRRTGRGSRPPRRPPAGVWRGRRRAGPSGGRRSPQAWPCRGAERGWSVRVRCRPTSAGARVISAATAARRGASRAARSCRSSVADNRPVAMAWRWLPADPGRGRSRRHTTTGRVRAARREGLHVIGAAGGKPSIPHRSSPRCRSAALPVPASQPCSRARRAGREWFIVDAFAPAAELFTRRLFHRVAHRLARCPPHVPPPLGTPRLSVVVRSQRGRNGGGAASAPVAGACGAGAVRLGRSSASMTAATTTPCPAWPPCAGRPA